MKKKEQSNGLHFFIKGKVQGVGFRYFTQQTASSMTLDGWVRNLSDGRVECLVCGNSKTLEVFENVLRQGPAFSRVHQITKKELTKEEFSHLIGKGFKIL